MQASKLSKDGFTSKRSQRSLRWMFFPLLLLPPIGFAAIVLFAPLNVLDQLPWLVALGERTSRSTAWVAPSFDLLRHARSTSFPQVAVVASVYAAAWWVAAVICLLFLMGLGHQQARRSLVSSNSAIRLLVLSVLALPVAWLCFFGFFGLPGDPSFARGLTSSSRVGYTVMGTFAISLSSLLISTWPIFVLATIDSLLERNSRG